MKHFVSFLTFLLCANNTLFIQMTQFFWISTLFSSFYILFNILRVRLTTGVTPSRPARTQSMVVVRTARRRLTAQPLQDARIQTAKRPCELNLGSSINDVIQFLLAQDSIVNSLIMFNPRTPSKYFLFISLSDCQHILSI